MLLGASRPPFDRLDLAGHVGDDPAVVRSNRAAVASALGLDLDRVALMDQVHGVTVAIVDAQAAASATPSADALVTTAHDLALTVLVADCVPVVLADDDAGVIAVAHAGRRGIQFGVVLATVEAMRELGADPSRIGAVVGPAVCPSCYEVPAQLRTEVAAVVAEAFAVSSQGTPALDLRRAVSAQLAAAGVGRVEVVAGCTAEDTSLFSYRRDSRTGRFAMLAWQPGLRR